MLFPAYTHDESVFVRPNCRRTSGKTTCTTRERRSCCRCASPPPGSSLASGTDSPSGTSRVNLERSSRGLNTRSVQLLVKVAECCWSLRQQNQTDQCVVQELLFMVSTRIQYPKDSFHEVCPFKGVMWDWPMHWFSDDMSYLVYGHFDSSDITLSEHAVYGDYDQVYPYMFRQVYLKVSGAAGREPVPVTSSCTAREAESLISVWRSGPLLDGGTSRSGHERSRRTDRGSRLRSADRVPQPVSSAFALTPQGPHTGHSSVLPVQPVQPRQPVCTHARFWR